MTLHTQFKDALSCFEYLLEHHSNDLSHGLMGLALADEELFKDVQALIDTHEDNLEKTVFSELINAQLTLLNHDEAIFELQGQQIDHFKLASLLGSGGMGAVYLATRNDGQINQNVAIKLFYPSIVKLHGGKNVFQEAQYLATLAHPNIASVLDVGQCHLGTYMIMEYIEGSTLLKYVEPLNQKERLTLFQKICDAVEYAHQHRVIHADLKPANILINNSGEPKLVDFGVARSSIRNHELPLNNAYIKALSQEYASPEQLAGKSLTTQSDIFSLGRILEKLVISPIEPELEAIINKAQARNPNERFTSADTLKQDLTTHLTHHPLLWFNRSHRYILGKFARRAPLTASLLTSSFILLSVACAGLYLYQDEQKQAAIQQQELLSFYQDLLTSSTPLAPQGTKLSVSDVLLAGVEQVKHSQLSNLNKQSVLFTVSKSLYRHGNFKAALEILALCKPTLDVNMLQIKSLISLNHHEKAQALWRTLSLQHPKNSEVRLLGWLTQSRFSENEAQLITQMMQSNIESELKFELRKHVFIHRAHHPQLNQDLAAMQAPLATFLPAHQIWWSVMKSSQLNQQGHSQEAKQILDKTLAQSIDNFHPLHSELAKINHISASIYADLDAFLDQEQALNKAMFIYQELQPNFEHELIAVLNDQYRYYLKERDYLQAYNFLNKQLQLCTDHSSSCENARFDSLALGLTVRQFSAVITHANELLKAHAHSSPRYYDILLAKFKAQYALEQFDTSTLLASDIDLNQLSSQQAITWLELVIQSNQFKHLSDEKITTLVKQAQTSPALAHLLDHALSTETLDSHQQWRSQLATILQMPYRNPNNFFQLPGKSGVIAANKRINAIDSPKHSDTLKIGSEFTVQWDKDRLIGRSVSMLVNHTIHYKVNNFESFDNIKQIDWHPAAIQLDNTGQARIDPYVLMANGIHRFKIMLVSDLGYWSLSDGLFSIASGVAIDNGLEHFLRQETLVTAVTQPEAFELYPIGQKKQITWDAHTLLGQTVAMYVLHDNPRGIGDKQQVDIQTLHNKRWYQFAQALPNTGVFEFDPALFNGRGSNYKLLIVSDQGYWSVSDQRFSVINPL